MIYKSAVRVKHNTLQSKKANKNLFSLKWTFKQYLALASRIYILVKENVLPRGHAQIRSNSLLELNPRTTQKVLKHL